VNDIFDSWSYQYWNDVPVVCIDTETTGFTRSDRICAIALVVCQGGEVIDEYYSLINPGVPIPPDATCIHGIADDDVRGAPVFADVLDRVLDTLMLDAPWVAHNMSFDTRMLSYDIPRERWPEGIPTLCTLDFAKNRNAATKMRGKHKLADLANYFDINYDPTQLHDALYDTRLLGRIVPKLMGGRHVAHHMTRWSQEWLK
jgi:DNA polymerase III epsilon subunit family exonuclease